MIFKNLWREIQNSRSRFLSILVISAVSVAFFAGVRATAPDMSKTADDYYDSLHMSDITLLGALTHEDLSAIGRIPGVEHVQGGIFVDATLKYEGAEDANVRLLSMPIQYQDIWEEKPAGFSLPSYEIDSGPEFFIDRPLVVAGRLPERRGECALDELFAVNRGIEIGQPVRLSTASGQQELLVCALVRSPLFVSAERGVSSIGNGVSEGYLYTSGEDIKELGPRLPFMSSFMPLYTQSAVIVRGASAYDCHEADYRRLVSGVQRRIEQHLQDESLNVHVFDRNYYAGFSGYAENIDKINSIAQLFPLIFLLVALLVSLTTMTRMVEEQRTQMGTLKALGYGRFAVMFEYVSYAVLAGFLGSVLGVLVGFTLFPRAIYLAYSILYQLPPIQTPIIPSLAFFSSAAVIVSVALVSVLVSRKELREAPSLLMRPRPPKAGKRIIFERMFFWKHLSFIQKVTARNLFRYKKRFFMSLVGIAGSCALLVTGFGLQDAIFDIADVQFGSMWLYDMRGYLASGLNKADMQELRAQTLQDDGITTLVSSFERTYDVGAAHRQEVYSAYVLATDDEQGFEALVKLSEKGTQQPIKLPKSGVVATQKLCEMLRVQKGDTLIIHSGDSRHEVEIADITENLVFHYLYMSDTAYQEVFGKPLQYNSFMAGLNSDDEATQDRLAERILQDKRVVSLLFVRKVYESVAESLSRINVVVLVLILSSAVLCFVVMYNLTNINITERKREMATLKVLGFTKLEMYEYMFRENIWLTLMGIAAGLVLGIVLHRFVTTTAEVNIVMFIRHIKPRSFVYSAVMTFGFSMLVNVFMRKRITRIDMVESLKGVE
jgi:putative ABC transport system permease protein